MAHKDIEDIYPLTPLQSGILFHALLAPKTGMYVGQIVCTLEGELECSALEESWQNLIQQYDLLRTAFVWQDLDEALQAVQTNVSMPSIARENWSGTDSELEVWLEEDRIAGFNFEVPPLMRATVLSRSADKHIFILTIHHVIMDGWSARLILNNILEGYAALSNNHILPIFTPPTSFHDYTDWLYAQEKIEDESYWRSTLSGFDTPTQLRLPQLNNDKGTVVPFKEDRIFLGEEHSKLLSQAMQNSRVTISTVFQYAWAQLLMAYSGTDDVAFGLVVTIRPGELQGIDKAIGPMINTVPVRVRASNKTVREALEAFRDDSLLRSSFEATSLSRIKACSEVPIGMPLFDTIVSIQPPFSAQEQSFGGLSITSLKSWNQSHNPISLLVEPGNNTELRLIFDPLYCDNETAQRILSHLTAILKAIPTMLDSLENNLPLMPTDEAMQVTKWSYGKNPSRSFISVREQIELTVKENFDTPAVTCGEETIQYGELWQRAEKLASKIRQEDIIPKARVAIFLDRGIDYVVAVIACLISRVTYIPLDPEYPEFRTRLILEDSQPSAIITSENYANDHTEHMIINIDVHADTLETDAIPISTVQEDDPAYMIYTSGSTGTPKGVIISQGNLFYSNDARDLFFDQSPKCFLLLSSFAFDSSVVGLYWTLTRGGTLVITPKRLELDRQALGRYIKHNHIDTLLCIPSFYEHILKGISAAELSEVRLSIMAGEAMPEGLPKEHRSVCPKAQLVNEFGPTESTVWCIAYDATNHCDGSVPVGRPIAGSSLHVLDSQNRPVGVGVTGELFVGGAGVALGYNNRPDMEASRFISDPFCTDIKSTRLYRTGDLGRYSVDGLIHFVGRIDRQVKINGYRIEPEEIEAALLIHPNISEAFVTCVPREEKTVSIDSEILTGQLLSGFGEEAERILDWVESNNSDYPLTTEKEG